MTRNHRHNACWPLLTTSKLLEPFHSEKIALKSFAPKILPVSLTRSRFCGEKFFLIEWNQDFRGIPGEGVYQLSVVCCRLSEERLGCTSS